MSGWVYSGKNLEFILNAPMESLFTISRARMRFREFERHIEDIFESASFLPRFRRLFA